MARLYLGTSGFAYGEWKGVFYPEGLSNARMLSFYAGRFGSVEINYTFRRFPAETTLAGWADQVPDGFRFALKAHRRITHFKRLQGAGEDVGELVRLARVLGDRLGPILVQCPPSLEHDPAVLSSFLDVVPADVRFAMEFRHPSWAAARDALAERGVAWCVAETEEQAADRSSVPPGPFGYLRLRKERYPDHELRAWGRAIAEAVAEGRDVFCYLKHEEKATGPRFAERLGELVAEVSPGSATR